MRKQNSGIQPTTKKIAALKLYYNLNASEKTEQHHHDSSDEDEEVQFSELHNFLSSSKIELFLYRYFQGFNSDNQQFRSCLLVGKN